MISRDPQRILITILSCTVTQSYVAAVHTPNGRPQPTGGSPPQQTAVKAALRLNKQKEQAVDIGFLTKADSLVTPSQQESMSLGAHLAQTLHVATAISRTAANAMQEDISGLVQSWVSGMISWPPETFARWQESGSDSAEGTSGLQAFQALPRRNESVGQLTDQLLKHLLVTSGGTAAIQQKLKTLQALPSVDKGLQAAKAQHGPVDEKGIHIAAPSSNIATRGSGLNKKDEPSANVKIMPVGAKQSNVHAQTKSEHGAQQQQLMKQAQQMVEQSKSDGKEGANAEVGVKDGSTSEQNAVVQLLLKQLHTFQPTNEAQAKAVKVLMLNLKEAYPGADPNGQIQGPNGQLGSGQVNNPKLDEHFITSLGGGTGARVGGTGDPVMDHHLVQRMHTQDLAVLIILFVIYLVTLFFGWSITYRMSHNSSPVKYYTNPRFHQLATEAQDVDGFLATFNGTPKEVRLEVAGFVETVAEAAHVEWRGMHYQTTFFFSLDLSQWVVPAAECTSSDRAKLRQYLGTSNSLETVDIHKDISWDNWEELATNIKHTIRQNGFQGRIDVSLRGVDLVRVYQNHPWANFMHNRTTKALFALSIVGGLLYVPYMWLRCNRTTLSTKFKVECRISDYWRLIHDKLSAQGFDAGLR